MLYLHNGVKISVMASSGARGWAGRDEGHGFARAWKVPFLLPNIPFVAKTVTSEPRKGNLTFWKPWRAIRLIKEGGVVNAVGLTNPSARAWVRDYFPSIKNRGFTAFASIMPADPADATSISTFLNRECPELTGIEVNVSCRNVDKDLTVDRIVRIAQAVVKATKLPVILKLGYEDPYAEVCTALDGVVQAFHLINAPSWDHVFPEPPAETVSMLTLGGIIVNNTSPLQRYGYKGAVSGLPIAPLARKALLVYKSLGVTTPVISGGGIVSPDEAVTRMAMGANAVSLGSVYLRYPWRVRGIVRAVREYTNGR